MSNVLYVQNLEKQIAAQKQLIAEQNRLNKERQEWALHTSEVIRSLNQQLAAKQAQIDELMLEYCPDEMTTEQLNEWAKHQVAVVVPKEHSNDI